jgi:predicted acetyltransferase
MTAELRKLEPEELEAYIYADAYGFGDDTDVLGLILTHAKDRVDVERVLCAIDGGSIVGAVATHRFDISIPGGSLPLGAVSNAFVFPTHRRQGLLTKMMDSQLREVHERGEPLSALTASESVIYGRYGFGVGTFMERWNIEKQHTTFAHSPEWRGGTRFVGPDEVRNVFPDVYRRATANRPGVIEPPQWSWDGIAADPPGPWRHGGTPFFHVVYEEDGRADGFATYRIRGDTVVVRDLMGVTDAAVAALWRYCFDIDLRARTETSNRPVDEQLYWMLADPRRLKKERLDRVWLRLVDVRAALSARTYMTTDSLVIEVKDTFCEWNDGRYELAGSPDGAECRLTARKPDIVMSAADLAHVYLGTTPLSPLVRAGRIEERTKDAALRASNMFAVELQPWCPFDF